MIGIEKIVMNRLGVGVLVFCVIFFCLCVCMEDVFYMVGVWYCCLDFDGVVWIDVVGFIIGNKGYICGGYNGKIICLVDIWEYDIDNDWWM